MGDGKHFVSQKDHNMLPILHYVFFNLFFERKGQKRSGGGRGFVEVSPSIPILFKLILVSNI